MNVKPMEPIIELTGIEFSHKGGKELFSGLDFVLRPGQRVGLTGANGAGKSTLLNILMGFSKPRRGEVRILGRARVTQEDFTEVRKRIGLLFQDSDDQLFCPTVEEDIAFGPLNLGKSHEETFKIVGETCRALGLSGKEKKVVTRLSFGEKRLAALAAVVAMNPECYLLDEPTNGLDKDTTERILGFMRSRVSTCLVITHDRYFLENAVEKVYELNNGRILPIRTLPA